MGKFVSTRNDKKYFSEFDAILNGLCDDGGLYVPTKIPNIDLNFENNYKQIALKVISSFFDEFNIDILKKYIDSAYEEFDNKDITPITKINDDYFLELYHGPTYAFKDVALKILPYFLTYSVEKLNIKKLVHIICATSGDTGKAALEGFKNVDNSKITVFYPYKKVSKIQELQMLTTDGNNTNVISVNGNFDECQNIVKSLMQNKNKILTNSNVMLSVANSINIGRLIPQIVYYFKSYIELVKTNQIKLGDYINFIIPTGNFGDAFAGFLAKMMGLKISKFVIASNKNDVLTNFFDTGIFDINRELFLTISPSIDILKSSNFERLLFYASNNDVEYVNFIMNELAINKKYKVKNDVLNYINDFFVGYSASEDETKKCIKDIYNVYNYLIDPHTAVGVSALNKFKSDKINNCKNVILSTASPYKFNSSVLNAISGDELNDDFLSMNKLNEITKVPIPINLKKLPSLKIMHNKNINVSDYNLLKF